MFNWGAIGQGVAGTIETGVGVWQHRKARKLRKKGEALEREAWANRTDFEIPEEIRQNLQTSKNEAYGKPALQQYMENNADRQLSNNLRAVRRNATSGADAIAASAEMNNMYASGLNDAAIAGANVRQQNMQNMYEAGNLLADYKSMAWDMNVNIPFLQRLQWAQDLQGAGYQGEIDSTNTIVSGQNQIGESAANFFNMGGGMGG